MATAFTFASAFARNSGYLGRSILRSNNVSRYLLSPRVRWARPVMCKQMSSLSTSSTGAAPQDLPFCAYPKTAEVEQHGVQELPASLPIVDFEKTEPYRSQRNGIVTTDTLSVAQILQMAEMLGASFAQREKQMRYIQAPKYPPAGLMDAVHTDEFGSAKFGAWNKERLVYWTVRLMVLTDPTAPHGSIRANEGTLKKSVAVVSNTGEVIGAVVNEHMRPPDAQPKFRQDDLFLEAVKSFAAPLFKSLMRQEVETLGALSNEYPEFEKAYANGKVAHLFMVARSEKLPKEDTFELFAATSEHLCRLGYEYMIIEGSNPWTGAACEALNGVRVHFAPFQGWTALQKSDVPLEGVVTSPNGWTSDKDSGCMSYVVRFT